MSTMVRTKLSLVLATSACLVLAACSGGKSATEQPRLGEESDTASSPEAAGSGGTIAHWQHHSDARAALVKDFAKGFEGDTDADIDFQSIPYESYFQKLGAALEAGNGPCVFQVPANILAEFGERGDLAAVPEDVMSPDEIEEAFTPASTRLLQREGQYYALPTDVQTLIFVTAVTDRLVNRRFDLLTRLNRGSRNIRNIVGQSVFDLPPAVAGLPKTDPEPGLVGRRRRLVGEVLPGEPGVGADCPLLDPLGDELAVLLQAPGKGPVRPFTVPVDLEPIVEVGEQFSAQDMRI